MKSTLTHLTTAEMETVIIVLRRNDYVYVCSENIVDDHIDWDVTFEKYEARYGLEATE
jgi:hypothetical protein